MAGIFIAGLMNVLMNGPAFALLQTVVDADMQGRVMALVMSLANAMTPLGLLVTGPLADKIGVNLMFIFASVVFVICGAFTLVNPAIRNIEIDQANEELKQDATVSVLGSTT
jgi:DHA3 family macrolide efflux protein-like MFS transporter